MTPRGSAKEELHWLKQNPPLHEMMDRYPAIWEAAGQGLVSVMEDGRAQKLTEYAHKARTESTLWAGRIRKSGENSRVMETALPRLIQSRMEWLALEKCNLAAATGKSSGKIRFNLVNGYIIQKLLFRQHLTRKAASLRWFRFWWPLLTQKRFLMPLVQPKGIFCFYTKELIAELAELLGERSCLEIAAGDGTLSRFLSQRGVNIRPTDDFSWGHAIQYPGEVEKLDAKMALGKFRPEAVVCSWPPAGNHFERHVFTAASVDLYIVIGSRYRFASGNWDAYSSQISFEWMADRRLSRLVLPPELDSAVLTFRRKNGA